MPRQLGLIVFLLLGLAARGASAAETSPIPEAAYSIAGSWPVGGPGGWDYLALDASGARLFVTRGDRVEVIQTASGKLSGTISHTQGVHGVAFAPALNRGFTSNGATNTVSVFELDTLRVVQEVPISGKHPDAIIFEPRYAHIITANGESSNLSVLDAGTLQVVATIALPGPPEFMAVDDAGNVYVNIATDQGKLVVVDGKALAVKSTWPLPGCSNPTGLAMDPPHHRLFSVCENQVMAVTDSVSGKQTTKMLIGSGPDAAAFDSDLGLVFSANGIDGTLTVIREETPDQYRVFATVTTQVSARTMILDPATHTLYFAAAKLGPAPPPTEDNPHPRPSVAANSFVILVARPK